MKSAKGKKHYKMGFDEVKIKTISFQDISQGYLFIYIKRHSENLIEKSNLKVEDQTVF